MHQHYKLLSVTFSLYQPTFYQIPIYSTAKGKGGPHETAGCSVSRKSFQARKTRFQSTLGFFYI